MFNYKNIKLVKKKSKIKFNTYEKIAEAAINELILIK